MTIQFLPHRKHFVSITKTKHLMPFREIMGGNRRKHPPPPQGATDPSGPGHPHYRGFTMTHTSSVGVIWTSDKPDAETST
jgi:hypothetical protein